MSITSQARSDLNDGLCQIRELPIRQHVKLDLLQTGSLTTSTVQQYKNHQIIENLYTTLITFTANERYLLLNGAQPRQKNIRNPQCDWQLAP